MARQVTSAAKNVEKLQKELDTVSAKKMPDTQIRRFEGDIARAAAKVEKLKKKIDEIALKPMPGANKLTADIERASKRADELDEKLYALVDKRVPTKEYGKVLADLEAAKATMRESQLTHNRSAFDEAEKEAWRLIDLKNKLETDDKMYVDQMSTPQYAKLEAQYDAAVRAVDKAKAAYEQAAATFDTQMAAEIDAGAEDIKAAEAALAAAKTAYDTAKVDFANAVRAESDQAAADLNAEKSRLQELQGAYDETGAKLEAAARTEQIKAGAASAVSGVHRILDALKEVGAGFVSMGSKALGVLKRIGGAAVSAAGKLISGLKNIGKHSNSSGNMLENFGKRVWGLAKRVFVFSLITRGFRQVLGALKDGVGGYLGWDTALAASVQNLVNALSVLRANVGAAFAPLIEVAVPILQTFVGWLTTAVNAIAAFIAALTGKSSYKSVVASTASAAGDTASNLGKAADNAKKLKKELADYDELHVIEDKDSGSGGSGGGGGGGAGGGGGGLEYVDVPIDSAIGDFAKRLKEAFASGDFTEIGQIIGTKLKEGLDSIPWDSIKAHAEKSGKSLATLINGFVAVDGLGATIGGTIGEAINTAIQGIAGFAEHINGAAVGAFVRDIVIGGLGTIDFETATEAAGALGGKLADFLNEIMKPETFNAVGSAFAGAVKTVIEGAHKFIGKIEFREWGAAIASGVNTFFRDMTADKWRKLGLTLSTAIKGILDMATEAVGTTDWDEIGRDIGELIKGFDWKGTLKSVGALILTAIKAAWEFLKSLGIHWDDVGEDIGDMIKNAPWDDILSTMGDIIMGAITAAWDLVSGILSGNPIVFALVKGLLVLGLFDSVASRILAGIGTSLAGAGASTGAMTLGKGLATVLGGIMSKALVGLGAVFAADQFLQAIDDQFGTELAITMRLGNDDLTEHQKQTDKMYEEYKRKNPGASYADFQKAAGTDLLSDETKNAMTRRQQEKYLKEQLSAIEHQKELDKATDIADLIDKRGTREKPAYSNGAGATELIGVNAGGYKVTGQAVEIKAKITDFLDEIKPSKKNLEKFISVISDPKDAIKKAKRQVERFTAIVNDYGEQKGTKKEAYDFKSFIKEWSEQPGINKIFYDFKNKIKEWSEQTGINKSFEGFKNSIDTWVEGVKVNKSFYGFDATFDDAYDEIPASKKNFYDFIVHSDGVTLKNNSVNVEAKTRGRLTLGNDSVTVRASSDTVNVKHAVSVVAQATRLLVDKASTWLEGVNAHVDKVQKAPGAYLLLTGIVGGIGALLSGTGHTATGGVYQYGRGWSAIPQYASGGTHRDTHGSLFVAGEAGPEIVGHINGRTEILNRSQLASTMYSAVAAAMSGVGAAIYSAATLVSAHIDAMSYARVPAYAGAMPGGTYDMERFADMLARKMGAGTTYTFTAQLDGKTIYEQTISQDRLYKAQTGRSGFDYL